MSQPRLCAQDLTISQHEDGISDLYSSWWRGMNHRRLASQSVIFVNTVPLNVTATALRSRFDHISTQRWNFRSEFVLVARDEPPEVSLPVGDICKHSSTECHSHGFALKI